MDFSDTLEEAKFRNEARSFLDANAELLPSDSSGGMNAVQRGAPESIQAAQEWQGRKADAGWACITWPVEYGGRAATPIQNVIWNQEEARYDTPPNVFTIGQGMLGPTIMTHGTPDQQARHLPKMLRGEEIWCQLFSEPGAGSDLAGLRTAARKDEDSNEWVISGQKIWTSGAHYSKWGMIVTRTDARVAKHAGITYFIIDMTSPGVEVRPIVQMNGATGFSEVFFNDVRVPDGNRIGAVNDGWRGAITTLMNERSAIGSSAPIGPGFGDLRRLARDTQRDGAPAIEDPAIRQRLADFYVRLQGLQYTRYRSITALSRGATPGPQSSLGKLISAPLRQQMASFATELQGAGGSLAGDEASQDATWQHAYLSAPGGRLAGGTDEILRNIIAERVLGLPPEVRLDKSVAFQEIPTGPPNS